MAIVESLYMVAAVASIAACAPQLRRLVLTKNSDSFSVPTWVMWTTTQLITFVYVLSIQAMLMALVNLIWIAFYGSMTVLIIYYRFKKQPVIDLETEIVKAVAQQE